MRHKPTAMTLAAAAVVVATILAIIAVWISLQAVGSH
jgi:hypothetical protein